MIAMLFLMNGITQIFALDSRWYVIGALAIAILNLCFSITAGTLQGMKQFFPYGVQTILTALGKLVFSVGFILIGWSVYGVMAAVMIGIVLAIGYGLRYMGNYVKEAVLRKEKSGLDAREFLGTPLEQLWHKGVWLLTSGDILLVKGLFFPIRKQGYIHLRW